MYRYDRLQEGPGLSWWDVWLSQKTQGIVHIVPGRVIEAMTLHELPADSRRTQQGNLDDLISQAGLLKSLRDGNNLLYEWEHWVIATTIWPYGNHHVMLMYKGLPETVTHIGHLQGEEKREYYQILTTLLATLEQEYAPELDSWEFSLLFGLNVSYKPGGGKSQSVRRPHTHCIVIDNHDKNEKFHTVKKISLITEWSGTNTWLLALNRQNLAMIRDFKNFLPFDLQSRCIHSLVTPGTDDFYALDFTLPWDMTNPEAIAMFESIHDEGIRFLEQVYAKNTQFVSPELLQCIGSEEEFEKIGFSIGFYQEDGVWNLRLKFSFKNPGENAGSLETLEHSICRVDQEIPHIPDQTRIRNLVKNTFGIWKYFNHPALIKFREKISVFLPKIFSHNA